jgi:hypothetical protein
MIPAALILALLRHLRLKSRRPADQRGGNAVEDAPRDEATGRRDATAGVEPRMGLDLLHGGSAEPCLRGGYGGGLTVADVLDGRALIHLK